MTECILITGGAGFIGCELSHRLGGRGLPVVAFDNLHPQVHATRTRPARLAPHATLFVGDVCERADWERLLLDYQPVEVVHLAAETGTGQSLTEAARHAEVNVGGTARMLDALSSHAIRPRRIVLASSRAVYGEGAWRDEAGNVFHPGQRDAAMLENGRWDFAGTALPFDARTTEARPTSIYGATKLAQEHILASWCRSFGVDHVILRLQNVYGPGQSLDNPYTGIVPLFGRLAKAGRSIPLYEDGAMSRDFVYIDDVADALALAVERDPAGAVPLDIGSGRSISIAHLARIVAGIYQAPPPHVCGLYRNGDVRHAACDPGAAMAALGWRPTVMAEEGVPALCAWIDRTPAPAPEDLP